MIKLVKAIALITCAGSIFAVPVPASASRATPRNRTIRIGSCRISGDFATGEASGWGNNPRLLDSPRPRDSQARPGRAVGGLTAPATWRPAHAEGCPTPTSTPAPEQRP